MITITSRKAVKTDNMKHPEYECTDVVILDVDGKLTKFPCRGLLVGFRTAVNHLVINGTELHLKLGKPKKGK